MGEGCDGSGGGVEGVVVWEGRGEGEGALRGGDGIPKLWVLVFGSGQ